MGISRIHWLKASLNTIIVKDDIDKINGSPKYKIIFLFLLFLKKYEFSGFPIKISNHVKEGKIFISVKITIQNIQNIVTVVKTLKIACKSKVGKNSIWVKKKTKITKPIDKVDIQIILRGSFKIIFLNMKILISLIYEVNILSVHGSAE